MICLPTSLRVSRVSLHCHNGLLIASIIAWVTVVTKAVDLEERLVGVEYGEVRKLLDEIRIASLKRHGVLLEDVFKPRRPDFQQAVNFSDGTEASINRAVSMDLFESDILLTKSQAAEILQEIKTGNKVDRVGTASSTSKYWVRSNNIISAEILRRPHVKPKRQALPKSTSYWSNYVVPYTFDSDESDWRTLIRQALNHVELHTCMRFIEKDSNTKDYLEFTRAAGCWSSVGRVGGRQAVSIGYGCELMGIVAHESLHALGLWHEQSRVDRDEYIKIDFDQIFPGTQSNFEKRTPETSDNQGQPYDLGSVMHYGSRAFSTDYQQYSIYTNDPAYQQTIGQRATISFKDAKMINLRYCQNICKVEQPCLKGGYTDPNNCYRCKCPDGYGGNNCGQILPSNAVYCNAGEYQAYTSPNNLTVEYVTANTECYYRIRASHPTHQVELTFHHLNFPCRDACESYIEVKYKEDKVATGARFCCNMPEGVITSEDSEVLLIFRGQDQLPSGYQGFILGYRSVYRHPTNVITTTKPTTTKVRTTTTKHTTKTTTPSTTTESYLGEWTNWAHWSECTTTCGGCGFRKRVRACYGGQKRCPGMHSEIDKLACGASTPCPNPYTGKTFRCDGRLVMPCNLLEQLDFGTAIDYKRMHISDTDTARAKFAPPDVPTTSQLRHKRAEGAVEDEAVFLESPDNASFLLPTVKNAKALKRIRRRMREERARRFVDGDKLLDSKLYCEKKFSYNCPTALLTISMDWRVAGRPVIGDDRLCCPGYHLINGECVQNAQCSKAILEGCGSHNFAVLAYWEYARTAKQRKT